MRIMAPCTFQTPNDLVDHWLPQLGEAEVKVLLVVFRKTFGWHKTRDRISTSQLEKLTGLTRTYIIRAGKSLAEKGIILREVLGHSGRQETYYELVINEDSNNSYPSAKATPPSLPKRPPPVCLDDPQKTSSSNSSLGNRTLISDEDIGRLDSFSLDDSSNDSFEKGNGPTQHNVYYQLSKYFNTTIRKLNPKITEKSEHTLKKWAEVFDYIIRIDKRSEKEIRQVLEFLEWDHFNAKGTFRWSYAVQSPQKLREHFATIYLQMVNKPKDVVKKEEDNKKVDMVKKNREIATLIVNKLKPELQRFCAISDSCVLINNPNGKGGYPLGYTEYGFADQLNNALRSCNLI